MPLYEAFGELQSRVFEVYLAQKRLQLLLELSILEVITKHQLSPEAHYSYTSASSAVGRATKVIARVLALTIGEDIHCVLAQRGAVFRLKEGT